MDRTWMGSIRSADSVQKSALTPALRMGNSAILELQPIVLLCSNILQFFLHLHCLVCVNWTLLYCLNPHQDDIKLQEGQSGKQNRAIRRWNMCKWCLLSHVNKDCTEMLWSNPLATAYCTIYHVNIEEERCHGDWQDETAQGGLQIMYTFIEATRIYGKKKIASKREYWYWEEKEGLKSSDASEPDPSLLRHQQHP